MGYCPWGHKESDTTERLNSWGFPGCSGGRQSACNAETQVRSLSRADLLEKGVVTYSSILAWRILWTEEPGGLQSMELQRWTRLSD